jgi:hypothetical protein
MAKDLPFFKFYTAEWNDGSIVDCSLEAQGLFINLCSLYWGRLGDLDNATAKRRLCHRNATAYKELISMGVVKVSDGRVIIDFLDEQLNERKDLSKKNSERALKRWKTDATAMPPHSERIATAMPIRGEEKREEERERRDVSAQTFGTKGNPFVSVKTKYLGDRPAIIYGVKGLIDYMAENQTILNQPEYAEKFLRKYNGQVYNELSHVQNAYRKFIEDQHK